MLLAYRNTLKCSDGPIVIYNNRLFFKQSTSKCLDNTCDVVLEKFGCKFESKRYYSVSGIKRAWDALDDEVITLLNIHYFPNLCFIMDKVKHIETVPCLNSIGSGNVILNLVPSDVLVDIIENYDNIYLTV